MLSYLLRRLLLFVPTLLGATLVVFAVMALAPSSPLEDSLQGMQGMSPGTREARLAYIEDRYGLDQPFYVRYLRWLNNVSPVGVPTWRYDDEEVIEQRRLRRAWREANQPTIQAEVEADLAEELTRLRADSGDESVNAVNRAEADELVDSEVRARSKALESAEGFAPLPGQPRLGNPFKLPDLGDSIKKSRPVHELILEALPVTLLLNAVAFPLGFGVALLTGIWAAKHRGGWQDWATGSLLLGLYAVPVIWAGVMLIAFLANEQFLRVFPVGGIEDMRADSMPFFPRFGDDGFRPGYLLSTAWHLVLPVICLSYGSFAYFSKLTRTSMLETLSSDFIRTARAKGLEPNAVLLRHGFRNSLIPVITFISASLPYVITGSIVVEVIFGINGMGRLFVQAINDGDIELVMSVTLVILLLKMLAYIAADIAYAIADPRISYA